MQTHRRVFVFIDTSGAEDETALRERAREHVDARDAVTWRVYRVEEQRSICNTELLTDLLVGARDDLFDMAIILSNDKDLSPGVRYIQNRLSKRVVWVNKVS